MALNIKFIEIAKTLSVFVPKILSLTGRSMDKIDREMDFIDSFIRTGSDVKLLKNFLEKEKSEEGNEKESGEG